MRFHRIAAAALLFAAPLGAGDKALHGRWLGQGQHEGIELLLNADGGGSFDGEALMYEAAGGNLHVFIAGELHAYRYALAKGRLTLNGADGTLVFTRPGAKAAATPPAPAKPAGGDDLSRLLVSSPWCSFSFKGGGGGYNSGGSYGRSSTTRVQFFGDGSYSSSSRSDSYSSNPHGSVAGQGSRGDAGRWAVKGGALQMSEGGGPMQPVALKVTRNSNGYPILNADGVEYSQCN